MGDRSNINIITEKIELGGVEYFKVLNIYSHSGGIDAQREALDWVSDWGIGRIDDPSYFSRGVIVAVCGKDKGATGSGVDLRICETIMEAASQISDNEHNVITFDLVNEEILVVSPPAFYGEGVGELIDTFSLSFEGAHIAKAELQ